MDGNKELARRAVEQAKSGLAQLRAGEVRMAEALVDVARHYSIDEDALIEHLCEKSISIGGHGVPEVSEFLRLEVCAALGMTETQAGHLLVDVLNLYHRHPRMWETFRQGHLRLWQAGEITGLCADLSQEAAAWVDKQVALTVAKVPFSRLRNLTTGWVAQADPALQAEKEEEARRQRGVDFGYHRNGSTAIFGRLSSGDARRLHWTLESMAQRMGELGDDRLKDERRAVALGMLADPAQAALWLTGEEIDAQPIRQRAVVHVHATDAMVADPNSGIARIEGFGPLTASSLPDFLRGHHVTVRPVRDTAGIPAVDCYEIPDRIRQAVVNRHPIEVFPYSNRASRGLDLDHIVPWQRDGAPGQTGIGTLIPLSRRVHRAKTADAWHVTSEDGGGHRWRSPLGYEYHTSPTGTIALGNSP